jgi:C-terminal processing protease CtpA/Prc
VLVMYGALITVADLIMADGRSLDKVGVTPDVLVLPTATQLAEDQDPVLAKAATFAEMKLDAVPAGKLLPFEWPPR